VPPAAWPLLTAFSAALLVVWWLSRGQLRNLAVDHPNQRSLHDAPVPRTGGVGLHAGMILGWLVSGIVLPWPVWCGLALLYAVSITDDVRGVPVAIRFAMHLLAAILLCWQQLSPTYNWAIIAAAAIGISWMINLYNFMDGSDGLAGGMTVAGFSCYGIAAWLAGSPAFALTNLIVAAAAAGFLVKNFYPARIFMGDVGSVPLGFLAATFGLLGWVHQYWPWWLPLLAFAPFILDATVTLARRLWRHERIWEAHRDHYYQRLVRLGWGHRRTALAAYALMAACAVAGITALALAPNLQYLVVGCGLLLCVLAGTAIDRSWARVAHRE